MTRLPWELPGREYGKGRTTTDGATHATNYCYNKHGWEGIGAARQAKVKKSQHLRGVSVSVSVSM